jgi:hypothetical protein
MNVVLAEPRFPRSQREFARALARPGATVVGAGNLASAYVRMRHPDYDVLRSMPGTIGCTLHVCAS